MRSVRQRPLQHKGPKLVEESYPMMWGLPKLAWVIVADTLAMCICLACIPTAVMVAKHKRPEFDQKQSSDWCGRQDNLGPLPVLSPTPRDRLRADGPKLGTASAFSGPAQPTGPRLGAPVRPKPGSATPDDRPQTGNATPDDRPKPGEATPAFGGADKPKIPKLGMDKVDQWKASVRFADGGKSPGKLPELAEGESASQSALHSPVRSVSCFSELDMAEAEAGPAR